MLIDNYETTAKQYVDCDQCWKLIRTGEEIVCAEEWDEINDRSYPVYFHPACWDIASMEETLGE